MLLFLLTGLTFSSFCAVGCMAPCGWKAFSWQIEVLAPVPPLSLLCHMTWRFPTRGGGCFPIPDFGLDHLTCFGKWMLGEVTQQRLEICWGSWVCPLVSTCHHGNCPDCTDVGYAKLPTEGGQAQQSLCVGRAARPSQPGSVNLRLTCRHAEEFWGV